MQQEILRRDGGTLSEAQVARSLGLSTKDVEELRQTGRLIGLERERHSYAYPAWQITPDGILPGLEATLADFTIQDPWMQAAFFVSTDPRLDGERPLDALRRGNVAAVRRAASAYGEHGAA